MKNLSLKQLGIKLALLAVLALPGLAGAQLFSYNQTGDVLAGFRKTTATSASLGNNQLVVNLGNVTNFLAVPAGSTINITNFSTALTYAFTDTGIYSNLQWSVFSGFTKANFHSDGFWSTPLGNFYGGTLWFTIGCTNNSIQSQPPIRHGYTEQNSNAGQINGVGSGAVSISTSLVTSNANNNPLLVVEPTTGFSSSLFSTFIADPTYPNVGDFAGSGTALNGNQAGVENTTPNPFTSAQRSDFYQVSPSDQTDPITTQTGPNSYYIGYFLLYPNGTMTFTAASSTPSAPVVGSVTSTVTNGFGPLSVTFTNTASTGATNWIWNFGDGTIITNTTAANVTHSYAAGGPYTVSLTVNGSGGSSTTNLASYIAASPTPRLGGVTRSGANLIFGGSNCPAGLQYRILSTNTLAVNSTNWPPVYTNTFLSNGTYSYTNSTTTNAAYFRLVSP